MALGFLVNIDKGIARFLNEKGQYHDVPADKVPKGLQPGQDFHYKSSKRGHIYIPDPTPDASPSKAKNSAIDRQQFAVKRLMSHGWSAAQASGIVGRFMHEAYADLRTRARNPNDPGVSEGIGQWNRERKVALFRFARAKKASPWDLGTQLDFFDHEIRTSPGERTALMVLEKAKTPEQAAVAMMHYERPGGYTVRNPTGGLGFRQTVNNANKVMAAFDPNYTPSVDTSSPGPDDTGTGGYGGADDPGNTMVSLDGLDQPVDTSDLDQQSSYDDTLGAAVGSSMSGMEDVSEADTSDTKNYIQQMMMQGMQANEGALPRLPTFADLFGNGTG